ncbi:MAG TPA: lamin tail domain-containing protein [Actinoplanes sp.]|nr:lamin tail domain-containing protein [Actinoplanes sp.]
MSGSPSLPAAVAGGVRYVSRRRTALIGAAAVLTGMLPVAPTVPAAAATAGAAATVACTPAPGSPRCQVWTGKMVWVSDGDTIAVDIAGDGTSTPKPVRFAGVQAMEQTVYSLDPQRRRGECHSLAATARVEQLIRAGGGTVRLTAQRASSVSRGRLLRSVAVKLNGSWHDVGLNLIQRGHALNLPFAGEWAWDATYRKAQAKAALNRLNLFDTDRCGSGPYQHVALDLWVNSDAPGDDRVNLNGEWVRVGNPSSAAVPIGGWWVRDSGPRRYTFPAGTLVPARGAVYLHVGKGRNTSTHKYWGLTTPVFENANGTPQGVGDGGYLFDPRGDLRAWSQYPCELSCTSALAGKIDLQVDATSPEQVRIVNTSAAPVNLYGHVVVSPPYRYPFTSSTVLQPGAVLRLNTRAGTNTGLTRFWGTGDILNNTGDVVAVRTRQDTVVECVDWGSASC